ncbi:MAG TPA: translation elongation factor Ts [Candidatus Limnocylindria bacterium]|nr:translation elongation factor Ts [Candidatus Limnocylindria bacterium]
MAANAKEVARLRAETGAGVMESKRALDEAGDYDKAKELLKQWGAARAEKKSERAANQGLIEAYIHAGGRVGALVELNSETDFVARNPEFQKLAKELAMQVAAMEPESVDALLAQPYIRDSSATVKDLVTRLAASTGENIQIRRFQRFSLGAAD